MSFTMLLSEALASRELPTTGDVLAVGLPLLREIADLHDAGLVTRLEGTDTLVYDGSALRLGDTSTQVPTADSDPGRRAVRTANPISSSSGVDVIGRFDHDLTDPVGGTYRSRDVHDDDHAPDRPVFVVGHRAWEQLHGVHDQLTDVHLAGLLLVSYATGLDLSLGPAVDDLALGRRNLLRLNSSLHPVVSNVLGDMIDPDRHRRPRSVADALTRLEHHRDIPADLDLDAAYESNPADWRRAVLTALRERVFDTSRRNRALYFRPTSGSVSLTDVSVPLLLNIERITPDDLLTWTGDNIAAFGKGKPVDLGRWCRFEESPHLAPSLDKLISEERKLRAEHGHGRLRLVIAFLRWVDPQGGDTVTSPLLVLPAELTKKKGVTDRYLLDVGDAATVNPVLRHVLSSRFGIELPESIAVDQAAITEFVADLERRVQATEPGLQIDLIDKPRISLIRRRAQLRVDAYLRRRAQAMASSGRWRRNDSSYDRDDWRPLGLSLFRRFVEPAELPLRILAGADPTHKQAPSQSFAATRERESFATASGDVSKQRWEVDLCAVTLASLGTRRSTLARDYDELLEPLSVPPMPDAPFEQMFSPNRHRLTHGPVDPISVDQLLVMPADSTQAAAVRRGQRGDSFIIQGPPGTGKSQTITNLIAALVADGKRVLFVCEKRAALDVVAHRLRQVGLGPITATIHDAELDRKSFIAELGETYERFTDPEPDMAGAEAERAAALAVVESVLAPLQTAFAGLHLPTVGGSSVAEIIERVVVLRAGGADGGVALPDTGVAVEDWLAARPELDRTHAALSAAGLAPDLSAHAQLRIAPAHMATVEPVRDLPALGQRIVAAVDRVLAAADRLPEVDRDTVSGAALRAVSDHGSKLRELADRGALSIVDRSSAWHHHLQAVHAEQLRLTGAAQATRPVVARWSQPLSADDARNGLAVAADAEGSFSRFLNGRWRSLDKLVRSAYRFDQHQVEPTVTQVLTELVAHHDAESALAEHERQLLDTYGTADTASLLALVDAVAGDPVIGALATRPSDLPSVLAAADEIAALSPLLLADNSAPLASVRAIGVGLTHTTVAHERAAIAWAQLASAPIGVLVASLSGASLDSVERSVLEAALADLRTSGRMGTMTGAQLDDAVDRLLAAHRRLLDANGAAILDRSRRRFADHLAFSEASMAGRSDEDKEIKKRYNAGRRLLEKEFSKKMRHRPIRELASGDSGLVVNDLRPVWLMSPLSVSTTLPLADDLFDVVIFDEASQIPVEDAVPTLFRAKQAIVVGDRMQLPPTRFFSAASEDDEVSFDDDGLGVTIALDADSFLTQADQTLDSVLLAWHYRSRSESLIDYSNHAFYEGRLATVPDRVVETDERAPLVADTSADAVTLLDSALERPISFHRVADGVYRDRRNVPEAAYVAELVRALLARRVEGEPGLTIGIAAFSEAQQGAIEDAIADLGAEDATFAAAFEEEVQRTDDGEYVGLFVKNLENVQGDERDVIIMSVCYAPDDDGKMRMNFGPINQAGGERRLNVIFSRAKQHMMIVSTIDGSQITNTHNEGAAHLARFLDYAEAESRGDDDRSTALLRALRVADDDPGDAERRSATARELADGLRARGLDVDVEVGRSLFTVDVGVRGEGGYVLGVMIDPGDEAENATARLVADAGVLRAFGWSITRVFISEWLDQPTQVLDRIHQLVTTPTP